MLFLLSAGHCLAQAPASPILLHVDLTDAPRHLLHAHLQIPVSAGPLTLEFPNGFLATTAPPGPSTILPES